MTGGSEFDNAATYFLDRHLERERGERVAVRDAGGAVNYGELTQLSHRIAHVLGDAGIEAGQRVVLLLPSSHLFVAAFFAVMRRGALPVPLRTGTAIEPLARAIEDCQAAGAIVADELYAAAAPALEGHRSLRAVFVPGDSPDSRAFSLETALANAGDGEYEAWPMVSDDLGFLLYTPGPGGALRAVAHRESSLRGAAEAFAGSLLSLERDDVVLSTAPAASAYGLGCAIAAPLRAGAATVWPGDDAGGEALVEAFAAYRPTVFLGTPSAYANLASSAAKLDASRTRAWVCAGGPPSTDAIARWRERYDTPIVRLVGAPELLAGFWIAPSDQEFGRPPAGYQLRVGDDAGAPVPTGEEGQLYASGPTAASLYWRQHQASQQTFLGPWTRTPCRARQTDSGAVELLSDPTAPHYTGS